MKQVAKWMLLLFGCSIVAGCSRSLEIKHGLLLEETLTQLANINVQVSSRMLIDIDTYCSFKGIVPSPRPLVGENGVRFNLHELEHLKLIRFVFEQKGVTPQNFPSLRIRRHSEEGTPEGYYLYAIEMVIASDLMLIDASIIEYGGTSHLADMRWADATFENVISPQYLQFWRIDSSNHELVGGSGER
jgi:hypothetical protein